MQTNTHLENVHKLQMQGDWLIRYSNNEIKMSRQINQQICSVSLMKKNNNQYIILPITYKFRSSVSHLDYTYDEDRWTRNKESLKSLINTLKQCEVWKFIMNKNFIQINQKNLKSKRFLRSQLNKII
jgi:hypothetical protein